jgi:hypothetical protein
MLPSQKPEVDEVSVRVPRNEEHPATQPTGAPNEAAGNAQKAPDEQTERAPPNADPPNEQRSTIPSRPLPPSLPFGGVHLLQNENPEAFAELSARVRETFGPTDFLEEIWAAEYAELVWEICRERRLANALQSATAIDVLFETLRMSWRGDEHLLKLVRSWGSRDPSAMQEVAAMLQQIGLSTDHIIAKAVSCKIDEIERLDRLTTNQSIRRDNILRELKHHRETAQERLQSEVEDAEFEVVEANSAATVPIPPMASKAIEAPPSDAETVSAEVANSDQRQ